MTMYQQINATTKNGVPVFTEPPRAFNLYTGTESEKYNAIRIIRAAGATVAAVSGCGTGYYIQITATATQANSINDALREAIPCE